MSTAWKILLALTFARMTMGFQFQAIPALALPLTGDGGMSFAALGTLTGAYLLPGVLVALAGGWLGQRMGDARVAFTGLGLMTIGGFAGWWVQSFEAALISRLAAGVGAVGLNVMVTKMAADWFESRDDLPTGMGVLVSSWPAGIALAALCLPALEAAAGLGAALLAPAVLCAVGWAVLVLVWRDPQRAAKAAGSAVGGRLTGREWTLVGLAGMIWAIYNVALVGTIAWTPVLLEDRGLGAVSAAAATSFIGWAAIFSVAGGGWLSARVSSRDVPSLACFALSAAAVASLPHLGVAAGSVWVMIAIGVAIGPAAAMIMTLPVEAARPQVRAVAMGIYFAIYYGLMGIGPAMFGGLRDATGDPKAPLYTAAVLLILCVPAWLAFRILQRRPVRGND
jgi:cyanate permease